MNIHEKYISRCIELGKLGIGNTCPNPAVGSCIVYNNKIIVNNNKTYYKKVFEGCTGLGFNAYTLFNQWLL